MVLFTHNAKKIKGAAHKNGYVEIDQIDGPTNET